MNLGCRESLGQELDDLLNLSSESEEDVDNQKLLAVLLSLWQQEPRRHVIDLLGQVYGGCCPRTQRLLLDLLKHDPVLAALPPRESFLLRLLKQVTAAAEDEGHELLEDLLEMYLPLVHTSPPITPWCFKTFYLTAAPSYHQLQQLVAEHAQQLLAAQQELGPLPSAAAADTEWFNPGCDRMTRLTGISSCSTISSMADQAAQQAEGQERGSADEEDPHCSASSRRDPAQPAAAPPPPAAAADAGHGTCHAATVRQGQERRKPPPPFLHAPAADATHTAAPSSTCSHPAVADGDASLGHRVTQVRLHQPRLISLYVSDNLFEGSTGCHEWEAGFVLGEWLVANHHLLAGRRVLELGCGSGLVGVLLAASDASQVFLTDGSLQSVTNCRDNLARNGVSALLDEDIGAAAATGSRVVCCPWQWEDAVPPPSLLVDVVVAADVLYDPKAIPFLLQLVKKLLVQSQAEQQQQQRRQPMVDHQQQRRQQQQQQQACGALNSSSSGALPDGSNGNVIHHNGGSEQPQQRQEQGVRAVGSAPAEPAAYLATTLRNPKTLETFVGLCESLGLRLQQVLTDTATGVGGGEQQMVGGCQSSQGPCFQAVRALSDRSRFLLHKLTLL